MTIMDQLWEKIFSAPKPPPRVRTKPMQVICVGPSRSATESLSVALGKIGYITFHGWDIVYEENPGYNIEWVKLLRRKWAGTPDGDVDISANDFDAVLGNANAVIDAPAFFFAAEMAKAYPDAKIILNTRRELDAWHRSAMNALVTEVEDRWSFHILRWLNADVYWLWKFIFEYGYPMYFRSPVPNKIRPGLERNGKWAYRDHCNMIRGLVLKQRLLEWSVEDGWEPLCEFLDKPCPNEPFPNTNNIAKFGARVDERTRVRTRNAMKNLLVCITSVGVLTIAIVLGLKRGGAWSPLSWVAQVLSRLKPAL